MKRIVDGLTYNTETSRLVAKAEWDSEDQYSPHYGAKCESELYQTRGGAFFQVTTVHLETRDEAGYPREREKVEFDPLTPERARPRTSPAPAGPVWSCGCSRCGCGCLWRGRTNSFVAVAMPERWPSRLSAARSAESMARASPFTVIERGLGGDHVAVPRTRFDGDVRVASRRNAAATSGSPEMTPALRATTTARACASAGIGGNGRHVPGAAEVFSQRPVHRLVDLEWGEEAFGVEEGARSLLPPAFVAIIER